MNKKSISAIIILLIMCCISSCTITEEKEVNRKNIKDILSRCKGNVVVIAKGYQPENYAPFRHYLILRDDSMNYFEYVGIDYKLSVGDTL